MRFDRLHIPAFGPFTNLDLIFSDQGGDLQVIYGSNEAGKSSLLRAFRDLLFGIHGQSPDNFLHDYKKLRIMGEIVNRTGERITFQRRKGNKNTLLDASGNELPDSALSPFLGSVDQEYFSTMFGLGTKELREGAEQLLLGKGDIGNALFSASMGGTPVQKVLAALTEESDRLFKGRSTANVSIRPEVGKYKDLLRKSRDAIVSPEVWEKINHDLEAAEKTKAQLEEGISVFARDLEWIARCEDALPTVGRLSEELGKLDALPAMPDVPGDFVQRARAARKAADDTGAEVRRLKDQLVKWKSDLAKCLTSPSLLAEADALDRLHQDLGVYRDRKNSLTDIGTKLAGLEAALQTGMENLGLTGAFSELETLRLSSPVRLACEETAKDLQSAQNELEKNREKTEDLRIQVKTLETQLEDLPETDLTHLRDALSIAAGATEANKTLSASQSEVNRLIRETKVHHQELTGAPKDLDATASLSIPAKGSIRRIGEKMNEIIRNIKNEETKMLEGKKQIESLQAELNRMERRGELPSEEALHHAREHRDHGWRLVLADWKGKGSKDELIPGTPLEEAFPQTIVRADDIADQLREQAEAVAQAEEKRFQIIQSEKQNKDTEARTLELQGKLQECQNLWEAEWLGSGILPRTPAEMEEWREAWSAYKEILGKLRGAEETHRQKNKQIQEARIHLAAALYDDAEKEFALLYDEAIRRVRKGEQLSGRRIELTNQLAGLRSQLESFKIKMSRLDGVAISAAAKWEEQCRMVGIPENITSESGAVLLEERKNLLAKFDHWKEVSALYQKTKDALCQYEEAIREKAIALGAQGDTPEARETDLWNRLTKARSAQSRYEQIIVQIDETKRTMEDSEASYNRAAEELNELICLAKIDTIEALEPLLARLELRAEIQTKISTLRDTLSGLARGQTVDDFISRIKAEDNEALSQRKDVLQSRKIEQETELQAVRESVFNLKGQRQKLEIAGDEAANYRQQAESCAARLKQDASHFVRLRLAAHFLQAQIERFRKENQGPLLEKSGEVFKSITQGAFNGLGAEFNADDTPVLVGLRPDHSSVHIEGMSDGARDQLYLALRLAALDRYLESHEPMPLILDDLLITCDNDRAAAILPKLAELSQRTQIFLFTHHDHLIELCGRTLGNGSYHLNRLNTNTSIKDI